MKLSGTDLAAAAGERHPAPGVGEQRGEGAGVLVKRASRASASSTSAKAAVSSPSRWHSGAAHSYGVDVPRVHDPATEDLDALVQLGPRGLPLAGGQQRTTEGDMGEAGHLVVEEADGACVREGLAREALAAGGARRPVPPARPRPARGCARTVAVTTAGRGAPRRARAGPRQDPPRGRAGIRGWRAPSGGMAVDFALVPHQPRGHPRPRRRRRGTRSRIAGGRRRSGARLVPASRRGNSAGLGQATFRELQPGPELRSSPPPTPTISPAMTVSSG